MSAARPVLTQAQIQQRLPVWHALADLFLDTELQPHQYQWIADTLQHSGYSLGELRAILEDEVTPAFVFNLLDIAGTWSGWSDEEVREIVLRSLRSRTALSPTRWLKKQLYRRHLDQEWRKIVSLISA